VTTGFQLGQATIAIDIAKRVFQVHKVDPDTGEVTRKKLGRQEVTEYFAQLKPCVIAMEACGTAQHWARVFRSHGHEVMLISPQFVRAFVKTNKNDAADAQAIWTASQQPEMRTVAIKSAEQQSILALHTVRERFKKARTAAVNQLHGLMGEYGVDLPKGWRTMLPKAAEALDDATSVVPAILRPQLRAQLDEIRALTVKIDEVEAQLSGWQRKEEDCQRIAAIPGVGLLTATAIVATVGDDAKVFRSGREFAAFLGLVPRQTGTGGKIKLLGISKRGDVYIRTLLIHGARSVMNWNESKQDPESWLSRMIERRPHNVVATALANKMARQIWALLAHKRIYEANRSIGHLGVAEAE
jgi:transposase